MSLESCDFTSQLFEWFLACQITKIQNIQVRLWTDFILCGINGNRVKKNEYRVKQD